MRWLGVGRSTLGAILGSILGSTLAGACAGGFTCNEDAQCTLAGEAGVCLAEGRCAFPDPDCSSGLAYPQGAPENAGECVPGEAMGSTDGTGETGGASSSTAVGTDSADGSGSSESSGSPDCLDSYEPNDDEAQAAVIPFGAEQDCLSTWDAFIEDPLDTDWFVLDAIDGVCPTTEQLTFVTDTPLELCVVPQCPDGATAELSVCSGSQVELASGLACCGSEQVRVVASCPGTEPEIRVGIAASLDAAMCLPYQAGALL